MYERKRRYNFLGILITSLVTSFITSILVFYFVSGYYQRRDYSPDNSSRNTVDMPQPQQMAVQTQVDEHVIATVAKMATPGVVGISVLRVDGNSIFEQNAAEKWGVGSGVIISSDGYILTNNHVVGGKSKRIIVSLADGREVEGVVLWTEPVLDLAVIKINLTGLTPIPFGDSNELQVGEPAIAIGNPLGLIFQRTVTSGIISALNRTIKIDTEQGPNYMEDLIQTDASINPGNSGGPLLNSKGQVIGINTIKVTSAEAIGFAIPINVAIPVIKQFIERGEFIEPYLGIFAYDKEIIPYVNKNISVDNGIYVANVDKNGPAFQKGIDVGCIIRQVDGRDINTMIQLRTYLYSKRPGDVINVTHISKKDGKIVTVPIRLAAKERDGLITR
ncbi:MAG TPA: trypsin-like serine protease [Clostridiaceae bacterium]|nr:trypsin-like serine protease [Clostridiaceae bacterium]